MDIGEIRLECLKLVVRGGLTSQAVVEEAKVFEQYVVGQAAAPEKSGTLRLPQKADKPTGSR